MLAPRCTKSQKPILKGTRACMSFTQTKSPDAFCIADHFCAIIVIYGLHFGGLLFIETNRLLRSVNAAPLPGSSKHQTASHAQSLLDERTPVVVWTVAACSSVVSTSCTLSKRRLAIVISTTYYKTLTIMVNELCMEKHRCTTRIGQTRCIYVRNPVCE